MFTGYEIHPLIQKYSNVKGLRDNSPANPKMDYMIINCTKDVANPPNLIAEIIRSIAVWQYLDTLR